jgi:hypothetical protein
MTDNTKGERWMKKYHVTFSVSAVKLAVLLQAVAPEATLVSVSEAPQTAETTPRASGYVGGKKNKGISAEALVLETMNQEPKRTWTGQDLAEVFVARGFASHSFTAACSKLVQEGKIRRISPGLFAPLGLSVHKGAVP